MFVVVDDDDHDCSIVPWEEKPDSITVHRFPEGSGMVVRGCAGECIFYLVVGFLKISACGTGWKVKRLAEMLTR